MSKIKQQIKDSISLTTYSDLWVEGKQHTQSDGKVVEYVPKQFIVTYKNKHMGICTEIHNITKGSSPKHIMNAMKYYANKNTVNISTVNATYEVVNGHVDFSKEINTSHKEHSMPIFSKKGNTLAQIDVNFLAILDIGRMYQLSDKWMSESLGYEGDWKSRKSHACLFAPDSYLKTAKNWADNDKGYECYLSPMRPSLKQGELELV